MQSSELVPRVVVGVDGSPASHAALRWAVHHARMVGGAVEAIYVWDTPSARGWSGPAVDPDFDLEQARERFAVVPQCEVVAVEAILHDEIERYLVATSAREVAPMIVALRRRAEEVRLSELDRFRGRYEDLDPRQVDLVDAVTRGLVAKLLHPPTVVV